MSPSKAQNQPLTRRSLLKSMGLAPLALRAAPLHGGSLFFARDATPLNAELAYSDLRLTPHYPATPALADLLKLVPPGTDEYVTEKYAVEIEAVLNQLGSAIKSLPRDLRPLATYLDPSISVSALTPVAETAFRSGSGLRVVERQFAPGRKSTAAAFLEDFARWIGPQSRIETSEFEVKGIEQLGDGPLTVRAEIRYDLVASQSEGTRSREERIGYWQTEWIRTDAGAWNARSWEFNGETVAVLDGPGFVDITAQALGGIPSYREQLLPGVDHWRTILDAASGIEVYGNNGVAAGDYDGDGFDDLYICQPAGLPNRLYRNRGDGTFEDITEKAGVGVLDGTACAIFADFDNRGRQDLLVVCGSGPLLFRNQGDGTFAIKRDAFQFGTPPQGTFTHAAVADYDRDGRLDIYFCLYSYYLGLDQYHYPVPYYDARNGPPNFLLRNQGGGEFTDVTQAAGLSAENDRYSFACAWGDSRGNGLPDLYVANDFGRSNLYRNNGDGTFTAVSAEAQVQDAGAGMSACWSDFNNDGRQDLYVANMWAAAGQRVAQQKRFHENAPEEVRAQYRRHARGNSLYRNLGDGKFENVSTAAGVEMGRWSWCSDAWDFDHDGFSDLYVVNGYISGPDRTDLASFFWRQVVAKSPEDATQSPAYERGWQALNELIRSDRSWSGYERNTMFANLGNGSFAAASGALGLDFPEDSRSFALADIDHDGRLEIVLKNRNSPQLRILRNAMTGIGQSIAFRLRGSKSNRDAIGASVTLEAGALRQTKYLQAGSGFLAQHSKEVFFGLGQSKGAIRATIRWPSGLTQQLEALPASHRIEVEEGATGFKASAFASSPAAGPQPAASSAAEALPATAATWLIDPLPAPRFSLPDIAGHSQGIADLQGHFALVSFWAATPLCREQLRLLQRNRTAFSAAAVKLVAINVDQPDKIGAARFLVQQEALSFPVLFADAETAGVYNLIYRYLFDRRRDLGIPSSFLLDEQGRIVRVYQGRVDPKQAIEDAASAPATAEERTRKALPFAGTRYHGRFERNDFTYGVAMFQHGYLDQAADSFRQVIATKPDDAEAYYNLGTLSLKRADLDQARQYLEQALKLKPNYPEAWNNLGMITAQQGRAEEAIRAFQQSLQLRPDYAIALLNLGNVYRRQRRPADAMQCLGKALELEPDDPEVNYSLGMFYAQQNQTGPAAKYLRRAIELRPGYAEARNNLGVLLVRGQDYAGAEEQFRACIRVVPGFDQSYLNLARLYALQSEKDKAEEILQQLLAAQPANTAAKQALEALR